jgi:HSP20 family molecular chaperone IbpA
VLKLSAVIDGDKIEAQMEKGVLTLTLAKKQSDQPVEIPISVQ